ncbi:MAG: gluconate 2-dehydrogenase subunit 3 family protein [Terriglobia bacterium]
MKKKTLETPENTQGISRREMVHRLMGGAAGGLIVPAAAIARPQAAAPAAPSADTAEAPKVATGKWTPLFLDPHQVATLTVIAEHIVPGSSKAGVTPFVDLLLSVDIRENQEKFIASLSMMDGESLRRYGSPFKDLSETRQIELLTAASTPARDQASSKETAILPGFAASSKLPASVLYDHFEILKGWISKAYYSSEVGMKELGWTGQYYFASFPSCEHSGT